MKKYKMSVNFTRECPENGEYISGYFDFEIWADDYKEAERIGRLMFPHVVDFDCPVEIEGAEQ